MKKYIQSMMLSLTGMLALTACSSSDTDYHWATASGDQVYFSNTLPSQKDLSFDESSFIVTLNRVKTDESINVSLTLDDATGTFSAPASVSFAAGSKTADVVINYDTEKLEYDKYVSATLSIADEAYTTPYGSSAYTFSAGVPSPYVSLGNGKFVEDFYWGFEQTVEIKQNQENPNTFRVYGAFDSVDNGNQSEYIELTVLQPGQTLFDQTITMEGLVYWPPVNTGYHHSSYDADIMMYHPSRFAAYGAEENWVLSKVLAYQEDGVTPGQIQLAPAYYMDGVGGWAAYSQSTEGMIIITFPGYNPKDYSLSLDYAGGYFDNTGQSYALLNLSMGEDVTEVKYALVEGNNESAAIDGVIDGTIASESVAEGGQYKVVNSYSGYCTLVAVAYDGDEVKNTAYAKFYYEVGGPQWVSLGTGLYTEDCLLPNYIDKYADDPLTYEVEIQENVNKPGLYRLVEPYGSAFPYNEAGDWDDTQSWYVIVDATDPEGVFIPEQRTSLNWGDGEFSIQSLGSYYMDGGYSFATVKGAGYMGTLIDGVITFPERGLLAIFNGDASFGNTNGLTKIVLPSAASSAPQRRAQKQNVVRYFSPVQQVSRIELNRKAPVTREQMR
ncbi:MAG: hypothetical protein IJS95_06930 [Prevotella sp.]|nr:hypothetical protein [Prevotella sp.]